MAKRDYTKATIYENSPQQIKNREARNTARRHAEQAGKNIGGKDVAHVVALDNRGSAADANTRVESVAKNRSWRKGRRGYSVPVDK